MAGRGSKLPGDSDDDELRDKYRALAAKYAALVQRMDRTVVRDVTLARLSRWALSVTPGALAVVRGGRMVLANLRFLELARSGMWQRAGADGKEHGEPLRSIVLSGSAELERSRARFLEHRLWSARGERLVSLRLERSSGRPPVVMALADDVTEESRRDQELQSARQALIQQERLRMLGEAAAAVAHGLGSTLRSLAFRIAALEAGALVPHEQEPHLKALSEGIESAAGIVNRLHEFARSGSLELTPVNLSVILRQATALLEMEGTAGISVDLRTGQLPFVRGSAAELSHLFLNLLRNARDSMREAGGAVVVRSKVTGGSVRVDVSDDGDGVLPQNMPRLFQPFFTTKGGQGTGLGLWLAAGTMRRMGGRIEAHRRRRGMIFSVVFPRGGGGDSLALIALNRQTHDPAD